MIIFYIGQKGFQASEQQKFNTALFFLHTLECITALGFRKVHYKLNALLLLP